MQGKSESTLHRLCLLPHIHTYVQYVRSYVHTYIHTYTCRRTVPIAVPLLGKTVTVKGTVKKPSTATVTLAVPPSTASYTLCSNDTWTSASKWRQIKANFTRYACSACTEDSNGDCLTHPQPVVMTLQKAHCRHNICLLRQFSAFKFSHT